MTQTMGQGDMGTSEFMYDFHEGHPQCVDNCKAWNKVETRRVWNKPGKNNHLPAAACLLKPFLVCRLASSSLGRVQRLTSGAVLTGQRLLARQRPRLLHLAHRGLELGLTGLLFIAVSVFSYGSFYSSVIPTQVNIALWIFEIK